MQRDTRPIPPTASGGAPAEISRSPQRASHAAAAVAAANAAAAASNAQPQVASSNAGVDSASSVITGAPSAASSAVPSPASGPLLFPSAVSSLFQRLDPAQSGSVSEEDALAALAPLFPRLAPNEIARWMREAQAKEQRRARRGSGSARGGKSVQSSPIMGPQPYPASAAAQAATLNLPSLSPLLRTPTPVAAGSSGFQRTVSDESVSSAISAVSAASSASSVGAPAQPPSGPDSSTGATAANAPTAEPERLTLSVFARLYARLAHLDANPASAAASSASAAAASAASNPASLSNQTVVLITSCMQNDFFHRFPRRRDSMNRYWVGRKDSERVLGFDPQRGPFSQLMNFIRGLQQPAAANTAATSAVAAPGGTNVQLPAFGSASQAGGVSGSGSNGAGGQNSAKNRDAGTTVVTSSPLTGSTAAEGPDSSQQQQQQRDGFNLDSLLTTALSNTNPSPSSSDGSASHSGSGVGGGTGLADDDAPLHPSSTPPPSLPDAPPEEEDDEYNHELEEAEDGEDHDVLRLAPQNSQAAATQQQQQQQQTDRRPATALRVDLNAGGSSSAGGASNAFLPLTLNSNHYSLSPLLLPQRALSSHSQPTPSPFLGPSSAATIGPAPAVSPLLSFPPSQSGGTAAASGVAQTPIHVIHLRTSIDRNKERGRQAIERYGEYCLMGTEGSRLCGNIEDNMWRFPTEHIIDTTRTLSSNSYRPLLKKLREIHGASKGPLRVAVIGGWTDEDVYHLCYELKTRTKAIEIATCSVLTASPSTSQHWNALGQMKRVIGVTLTRTVRELVQWFGVGVPASASSSSLLPAFSHTRPSEKERYWPTFVWNTPTSADGGEAGLPPKGFNPAVDGEILAHLYRNSSRIIIDIVGGSFTASPNAVVLSIRSVDKATVREAPSVTKLARTEDVATEYQAFHRVEEMLGNNAPMVRGFVELADRAGIKFRYTRMTGGKDVCSMSELCTDLSTHYSTIAAMIDEVYSEIFLPWYAGARLEFFDLFAYWFDGFTLSLGRVWNAVKKVDRVHCDPGYLQSFISYCLIRKGTDAAPPGKEDKDFYSFPPHTAATFSFPLCDPLTNLGALFAKPSGVPYLRTLPPQKLYACFSHGNARLENFMCEGAGAHGAPTNGSGGAGLSSGNYSSSAANNPNSSLGGNGNSGSSAARGNVWIVDFYYTESRNHCLRDLARTWCCLMYLSTEINNDTQFAQALLISAEVARARDLAVPLATQLQGLTDLHLRTIYSLLCRLWSHAARIVKERSGAVQFQMGLLADSMRFFLARARNIYAKRWALSTAVMLLESILLQEKRIHSIKPAWIPLADNAVLSAVRGKLGLTRCPGNRDFLRFKKHSSANDDLAVAGSNAAGGAMVPLSLTHPSAVPSAVSAQSGGGLKPFQMPLGRNSLASSPLMGATVSTMMPARLASPALRPLSMGAPSNFALLTSGGAGSAAGGSGGAMSALSLPRAVAARYSAQNPSLLPPNEDPRAIEALERAQVIHDQAMALKQEALEEAVEEDLKVRRLSINVAAAAAGAAAATAGPSAPNSAGLQRDSSNESASGGGGGSTVDAATVELRSKRKQDAAEEERKKEHARMLLEQEQERARYEKAQALRKAAGGASAPGSFKSHHPLADEEAAAGADEEIEEEMAAADEAERAKAEAEALAAKQKMDRMLPLSSSSCDLHSFPPFASGIAAQQSGASNLSVPLNQTLSASFSSPHLSALLSAAALPAASNAAAPSSSVVPVSKLSRVAREVSKLAREGTTHVLLLLSEGDFVEMGVDKIELQRALHEAGIKQLRVMVSPGPLEISVLIELVQVVMSVLCEVPAATAATPAAATNAGASTPAAQPSVQSPAAASTSAAGPAASPVAAPAENKLLLISKSGFHRGGTLAACVLCAFGLSVDRSIRLVRDARGARTLGRAGSEALIHKFDAAFKKYLIERVLQSGELFHSAIERPGNSNGNSGGGAATATATTQASNSNGAAGINLSASALPFGSPVLQPRDSDTPGGFGSSTSGPGSNRSQIKIWPTKEQAIVQK